MSANTARVAVGILSAPVPVISGAVRVGSVLMATGAWGPAPVTLKYQWKANGVSITGATPSTYTPTTGSVLTAVPGAWGPAPVTLTYQWYANGMPLNGETKSTYTPMLPGYAISVRVTGTKPGVTTAVKTSAETAPAT